MSTTRQEIDDFIKQLKLDEVSSLWETVLSDAVECNVSVKDPHDFIKVAMQQHQWNGIAPVKQFKNWLNEKDDDGNMRLHRAVINNNYEDVELLLSYGAAHAVNNAGFYPLGLAKEKQMQITLIKGGAYPTLFNRTDSDTAKLGNYQTQFQNKEKLEEKTIPVNELNREFKHN